MIEALEREVREAWGELAPHRRPPARVYALKWSGGDYPGPGAALLFFLFADGDTQPVAVAKVARVASGDAAVVREAEQLERARAMLPAALRGTLPELVRAGAINGRAYLITEAAPGAVELHHTWGARRARKCNPRIAAALDWCTQVAEATASGSVTAARWLGVAPATLLDELTRCGLGPEGKRSLEARLPGLLEAQWPAGLAHGDFFPGNVVFASGGGIRVVDWALAESPAPFFFDLLTYELSFALHQAFAGQIPSAAEHRQVSTLPAFEGSRRHWSRNGVALELGSDARLATALRSAWRDASGEEGRERSARAWVRVLELELRPRGA